MINKSNIICPKCKQHIPTIKSINFSPKKYQPSIFISCSCSKYLIKISKFSFLYSSRELTIPPKQSNTIISTNYLKDQIISYFHEISNLITLIHTQINTSFPNIKDIFLPKLEHFQNFFLKYENDIIQFIDSSYNNILTYNDNSIYSSISLFDIQQHIEFFKMFYNSLSSNPDVHICEKELYNYDIKIALINETTFSLQKESPYYICSPFILLFSYEKIFTYHKLTHSMISHKHSIESICELPNGEIVTGGYDKLIKFWKQNSFAPYHTLFAHNGSVITLCPIKQNQIDLLASGSSDGLMKIWNIHTKTLIKTLTSHQGSVIHIIQLSNLDMASCSLDTSIRIWKGLSFDNSFSLIGHTQTIEVIKELNDNNKKEIKIISICLDSTIKIWNVYKKKCIISIDIGNPGISFDLINKEDIVFITRGNIMSYNLEKKIYYLTIETTNYQAYSIKYIGGNLIAVGCGDSLLRIYDLSKVENRNEPICIMKMHEETIIFLANISNDRLCSSSWDGTFTIMER